jgi:ribosome-binding factor A
MPSRKPQVESLLKRAVAEVILRDLSDPRIKGMVSVTRVEASPDLKRASVYVSVLPEQYESRTIHGLKDATMRVQHGVKKRVALRLVPHLEFKLDEGLKKQAAIFADIDEGLRRSGESAADESAIEQPNENPETQTDHKD